MNAAEKLGCLAHENLERLVAIDSASDENSETIPSTEGQRRLAEFVAGFLTELGATVERDDFANVIASFPGRGCGADQAPVAMMVHLDTARGTAAVDRLEVQPNWAGDRIPFPNNPRLVVDTANYPDLDAFIGHDVVFGPGDAPFGLDDKLGLTHLMTLVSYLREHPELDHPPFLIVGRPDEEIGRMAAVESLAKTLAERGVDFGYTIDGILPFEINVENFNAAAAQIEFAPRAFEEGPSGGRHVTVQLNGVNTHGATARPEGHRAATRFAAEIIEVLVETKLAPARIVPVSFESDALRDCDARVEFVGDDGAIDALTDVVATVVDAHVARGAYWHLEDLGRVVDGPLDAATWEAIRFVGAFIADDGVAPILAEDSDGRQGYTHPYRIVRDNGGARLDLRIRDFDPAGLDARKGHIGNMIAAHAPAGTHFAIEDQYVNMAPRLADRPELSAWPAEAAARIGVDAPVRPIRGGTGVDPFLDAGVPIANLGTGYFAPESEKELTSRQLMARHTEWLAALLDVIAKARTAA